MMAFGESTKKRARLITNAPLQVEVQGRLGIGCDEAFRFVTDATKLSSWLPMGGTSRADDRKAQVPGGVGSVRVIVLGPTPPTRERVIAYEPSSFYAYSTNDASFMGMYTDHLSAIGFEPHPEGGTVVTWLAYARPGRSWFGRYVGLRIFRFVLGGGMRNLQKRFPVR